MDIPNLSRGEGFYQPFVDGPLVDADYIAKNIYKPFIFNEMPANGHAPVCGDVLGIRSR
ncbi:MAG: hypothetical protein FWB78_11645 [Treponema sp.]|nr:hypothetical protein [Treponema sp.]